MQQTEDRGRKGEERETLLESGRWDLIKGGCSAKMKLQQLLCGFFVNSSATPTPTATARSRIAVNWFRIRLAFNGGRERGRRKRPNTA